MAVAELVYEMEMPISFTCGNATGIEKGTLLVLSDPMTVAASAAADTVAIGVAAEEKIASDGRTKIGVYLRGIFKMTVGAAGVTAGKPVAFSGANAVVDADAADNDLGRTLGRALETATSGQTALILVGAGGA